MYTANQVRRLVHFGMHAVLLSMIGIATTLVMATVTTTSNQAGGTPGDVTRWRWEAGLAEQRSFKRGDAIPLKIVLTNDSSAELSFCWENADYLKGVFRFRFVDSQGAEVPVHQKLNLDYRLHPETDLVLLKPGEHKDRTIYVDTSGLPDTGRCDTLSMAAIYFCPLESSSAGEHPIISGSKESSAIRVIIDSRGWWRRLMDGTCG